MASNGSIAKAYIQLVPTTKGFKSSISKEIDPEMEEAGKSSGSKFGSAFKKAIALIGIGKIIKDAIFEGGALQQSLGGVETMFKEHADAVKKNANEAYRTTGLSANDYMEQVTSFSASLLQSMGNDTEQAGNKAHMAMVDMSDNANKFGTDMQSIQNAYQGFAKQNYTMLDNLKLGYGGTKSEMERLLADATKLSGVKYDINNLADVYDAIHVIQEEMGVTGTTAKEASETLGGSFNAMKAAYKNLIGQVSLGQDIGSSLDALSETVVTFVDNLMPMVTNVVTALPGIIVSIIQNAGPQLITTGAQAIASMAQGIASALPTLIPAAVSAVSTLIQTLVQQLPTIIMAGMSLLQGLIQGLIAAIPILMEEVPKIIDSIIVTLTTLLPRIIDAGIQLFVALVEALPEAIMQIVEVLPDIIDSIVTTLLDNLPILIDAGVKLFIALIENLPLIIQTIVKAMPKIISGVITAIIGSIPQIVSAGVQLFVSLVQNLPEIIVSIVGAIPAIITGIVDGFLDGVGQLATVGGQLIAGLTNGIADAAADVIQAAIDVCGDILDGILDFFGIHSPSRVFAEIGKFLDEGLAKGIEDNIKPITKAMDEVGELTTRSFESNIGFDVDTPSNLKSMQSSIQLATALDYEEKQRMYSSMNPNSDYFNSLVDVMYGAMEKVTMVSETVLDGVTIARTTAKPMSVELGRLATQKGRG